MTFCVIILFVRALGPSVPVALEGRAVRGMSWRFSCVRKGVFCTAEATEISPLDECMPVR